MAIFFTSDLHLGHHNILKYCDRPFENVAAMEEYIVAEFNKVVSKKDTTYFLGDVVMGNKQLTLKAIKKLNGKKILITGNHDNVFNKETEKAKKNMGLYLEYFDEIYDSLEIKNKSIWPTSIKLHHFPHRNAIITDSADHEPRFAAHRPFDDGKSLYLHGHVHCKEVVTGERSFHVGVDAHGFKPVSVDTIRRACEAEKWIKYSRANKFLWKFKKFFSQFSF